VQLQRVRDARLQQESLYAIPPKGKLVKSTGAQETVLRSDRAAAEDRKDPRAKFTRIAGDLDVGVRAQSVTAGDLVTGMIVDDHDNRYG
jgi:hypothetical protein